VTGARLTVATSFPIHPPQSGGQMRVYGLYRALAAFGVQVEVVALVEWSGRAGRREVAPGLHEIRVPRSTEHNSREFALQQRAGVPVGDVALALYHELTPAYRHALRASAEAAAAVIASHPYSQPAIASILDRPLVYEAHNVEIDLKRPLFEGGGAPELVQVVAEVERRCCDAAGLVLACSPQDAGRLQERYGIEADRVAVVPNGVDLTQRRFVGTVERARLKARLGLDATFLVVFVGSWHEPNLVALDEVLDAARELPDIRFAVAGSVGLALDAARVPANVDVCGVVDAAFVSGVLAVADLAVNPMRSGSGTNLKMLDYAAAGVPLLSTSTGARGLELEPGRDYAPIGADGLAAAIAGVRVEPPGTIEARAVAARALVEGRFDWRAIAGRWAEQPWMARTLGLAEAIA
jgi:glycosyltransferase involved in cell wall biosynthesis